MRTRSPEFRKNVWIYDFMQDPTHNGVPFRAPHHTISHAGLVGGVPVYVDEKLPQPLEYEGRLNFRERYARLSKYFRPILKATRQVKPVSIGVFGDQLEYGRLKWWAVLFVMLIVQAPAGERRNWTAFRSWAAGLPAALKIIRPALRAV